VTTLWNISGCISFKYKWYAEFNNYLRAMIMKLRINGYSFGKMVVGGREFTSDLIIHPDGRIQDSWWRSKGHSLLPGDIATGLDAAPEKLIIGTGSSGMMRVSESVIEFCQNNGIKVKVNPTTAAVLRFNEAVESGTIVAACFHLTC